MATTPNPTKVITGKVRLSYANLFTARANDDGTDTWGTALLIPKSDKKTLNDLKKAAEAALAQGIKDGKLKPGTSLKNAWKTLRDGDERDDLEEHPEYAGHFYMNVSAYQKPGIVDQKRNPILDSSEVYSGMYARLDVNAYAYDKKGNKGVTFGLNNVQKWEDGEFLGGRARAEDVFDELDNDLEDDGEEFSII